MPDPTPAARMLLVEDEKSLARTIAFNLEQEGYRVEPATSLAMAHRLLAATSVDLIILDLMLPDGSGLDLLQDLRDAGDQTPVLILTARRDTTDVVTGLRGGADDYLGKPFALDELLSRVEALLRRRTWMAPADAPAIRHASFGSNRIDLVTGEADTIHGRIRLTEMELKLLRYFVGHCDLDLPRQRLQTEVWDLAVAAGARSRSLDTFVLRLRRHLEVNAAAPQHIRTIYGVGYRFHPGEDARFTA